MVTFNTTSSTSTHFTTHEVQNQPPPLLDYNMFTSDVALMEGVRREGAEWDEEQLIEVGRVTGSEEMIRYGFEANESSPVLHTHDRYGHRIDEVAFHPAWHALMSASVSWGTHASPWRDPKPGAHVARAATSYMLSQVEAGHGCPISMTYASIPVLRTQPELAVEWEPRLTSLSYDPGLRSPAEKRGILCGMAMTEKQGGSDVRANTTRAQPEAMSGPGNTYRITGHKWFCSAPMCDIFLVLAQAPHGLSCFLLPRVLSDGTRNSFSIQRLKSKLGNRSNASSEIEFDNAWAVLIGEEGRGVRTIVEMVNYTRLDCVIGTSALMRQAVAQATHHAAHRSAFGRQLIAQPLMRNVLADLALESEAATALALRLARACDNAAMDEQESHIKRLGTALAKYWVSKRGPVHIGEALECLGGNGYVEESIMPRLYREAPLNSIWEGSGNVNCLDVLRALSKEPRTLDAYFAEIGGVQHPLLRAAIARLQQEFTHLDDIEWRARWVVEQLALVLQAALLLKSGNAQVAEAFCLSRLSDEWGRAFGTLSMRVDAAMVATILERAQPKIDK